ncbi:MAG: conjugal transfer protein TraG N-terminal domain-containing protein [Candidatus Methanomethylicaceae archaeon]
MKSVNIGSSALFWGTFLTVPLLSCLLLYLLFGRDGLSVVLIAYTAATVASVGIFFYWMVEYFQKSIFLRKLFRKAISKKSIKFVVVATAFWLPSVSLAFDPFNVEYVTYNGFSAVAGAFQTIGLVFSDSGYAGLFFTAASLGLLFGGMAFYMKKVTGAQLAPLAWAMPVLLGLALYVAFYVPKGKVTVYDEVTGRTQTFGNIPIGVTTMAGMTNLIEKGIAGIVTTAGGSSYISGAGGIGYEAVIQIIASGISTKEQSVDMTLARYIQDCLFFELSRSGTTLSIQDIRNGTTDLMTALAQSVNPAAYTVVYLNKPEGETKTCTDAWNMLSPKLNDPNFFDENVVKAACNSAGFDSSNPLEFSACTTTLNYTLQQIAKGNPLSYNDFARKTYIALNIEDFVRKNGAVPLSNYYISQQGSTTALVLNQWIPIIKANLTALILCLTPFLLIFLPTPLAGRVVAMIAGFFIWITMLGIADAITHEIIVTQASNIFEKVRNNKWGYDAIMLLPDSLSRSLSLFGYIRSAGMTLATIMTTMLVKFGGTALAMYTSSISSTISSSAARGSHEALTPHGSANTIMESSGAPGKLEAAGLTSFTERALASKGNTMRSIWSGEAFEKTVESIGGSNVKAAMQAETAFRIGQNLQRSNRFKGDIGKIVESGGISALGVSGNTPVDNYMGWTGYHLDTYGEWQEYIKGVMRGIVHGGAWTKLSGANFKTHSMDVVSSSFDRTISSAQQEASQYSIDAGRSFTLSEMKQDGTTHTIGKDKIFKLSEAASHRIAQALSNSASEIFNRSTSIKDEKGRDVTHDARAFNRLAAEGGLEIMGIGVSDQLGAEFAVTARTREGTVHTYHVGVDNKSAVEKRIGEEWTKATSEESIKSFSESDKRSISSMLEATKTKTYSERLSRSWSQIESLNKAKNEHLGRIASMEGDRDHDYANWYRDKRFGRTGNEEIDRHNAIRALEELNSMMSNDKERFAELTMQYIQERGVAEMPKAMTPPEVPKGPSDSPVKLSAAQETINNSKDNIANEQKKMQRPRNIDEGEIKNMLKRSPKSERNIQRPKEQNEQARDAERRMTDARHNAPDTPLGMLLPNTTAEDIGKGKEALPSAKERFREEIKDLADSAAPMPFASEKEQERRQERLRQGAKRALGDYSDYENKYWEKQGAGKQSNEPPKIK